MAQWQRTSLQCRSFRRRGFDPWVGKIPWRRAWQPTPVFLPGESHGQRRLVGSNDLVPDTRTNLWLDVRTHVCIFESCQLEGSQVGGLLYTIKKNSWNQKYCFWKLILIPTCLCFISSLQSEKAGTFSFLPLTGILRTNGKIISKWLELLEEKLSVNLSYYYYYHHQLQSGFKS